MTTPTDGPDEHELAPIEAKLAAPIPVDPDCPPEDSPEPTRPALADRDSDNEHSTDQSSSTMQGRGATLGILFLVTGALGIPLLWMSPHFTQRERLFWSVIVLIYTITLLAVAGGVMWWLYKRMLDFGMFG